MIFSTLTLIDLLKNVLPFYNSWRVLHWILGVRLLGKSKIPFWDNPSQDTWKFMSGFCENLSKCGSIPFRGSGNFTQETGKSSFRISENLYQDFEKIPLQILGNLFKNTWRMPLGILGNVPWRFWKNFSQDTWNKNPSELWGNPLQDTRESLF